VDGPATAKLRGPYRSVLVAGTARSPRVAERRRRSPGVISNRLAYGRQIAGCQYYRKMLYSNVTAQLCRLWVGLMWKPLRRRLDKQWSTRNIGSCVHVMNQNHKLVSLALKTTTSDVSGIINTRRQEQKPRLVTIDASYRATWIRATV